ncbi:MAG: hypothetical protein KF760_30320 [Candidatus Eremiobacteraeota bacterium]|nr:hypothetical protein [Candidatus Eremiobacteraeota bacterium]MCW5868124.1 hypothetical protein [Candidatus Eremiobacteraeota bacterium]
MLSAGEELSGGDLYQGLRHLVSSRLALDLSRRSARSIAEVFSAQAEHHRCRSLADYQRLLELEKEDGPAWARLIDQLTIAETYFFRDTGQMELLRNELFPRLLRESEGRPLRVWSAGCSTGEEPYSLAILLDGLPSRQPAQLAGTDINLAVLQAARKGFYRERSLRSTPPPIRQNYFIQHKNTWELLPRIRDRVSFWPENLAGASLNPRTGLDLIVCRNVLIYFERSLIAAVLERFMHSLRPGGFLLTGHGELQGLANLPLDLCSFENSIVYQRPRRVLPALAIPTPPKPAAHRPVPPDLAGLVAQCLLQADYARGQAACQKAARERPLEVMPRLLEARLARAQGRWSEARDLLSKALYLDPDHGPSLLEMALVHAHEGDLRKARKLRQAGLECWPGGRQDLPEVVAELDCRLGKSDG